MKSDLHLMACEEEKEWQEFADPSSLVLLFFVQFIKLQYILFSTVGETT